MLGGSSSSPVLRVRTPVRRPVEPRLDLPAGCIAGAARRSGRGSGPQLPAGARNGVADDVFARFAEIDRKLDVAVSQLEVCVAGVDLLKRHHLHGERGRQGRPTGGTTYTASSVGSLPRQALETVSAIKRDEGSEEAGRRMLTSTCETIVSDHEDPPLPHASAEAGGTRLMSCTSAGSQRSLGPPPAAWVEDLAPPANGQLRASASADDGATAAGAPPGGPPRSSPCPVLVFSDTSRPVHPGVAAGEESHAAVSMGFGMSLGPRDDSSASESNPSKRSSNFGEVTRRARATHSPSFLRATISATVLGHPDLEGGSDSWRFRTFQRWGTAWALFVVCSVLIALAEALEPRPLPPVAAAAVETAIEVVFAIELTVRFLASQGKRSFIKNPFNVIDFVSVLPVMLRALVGFVLPERIDAREVPEVMLVCVVPVLRLAKVLRRDFVQIKLFERVFSSTMETMQFLALVFGIIVLTFAFLVFLTEPRDNVDTYWRALYLVIVTMSTVGYGDVSPVTDEGHVVISVLIMSSILFMAIPVGVLGNAFSFAWSDRDLIMLVEQTRQQISQWGYQPTELPKFFSLFDSDNDGELNFDEFVNMMNALTISLKGDRMVNLFQLFDRDNGGTIDQMEFLRAIYPHAFHQLLNEEKKEKERQEKEEKEQQRRRKKEREERRRKLRAEKPSTVEERTRGSLTSDGGSGLASPRPGSDNWPRLVSPRPGSD